MKKLPRLVAMLLVLLMSAGVLAACDTGVVTTETASPIPDTTAEVTAAPATPAPPMALTVLPQNDGPQDPDSPVTAAINAKFNVEIEYIYLDRTTVSETLPAEIASGNIPDVMLLNDTLLPMLREQGALAMIPLAKVQELMPVYYEQTTTNAAGNDVWSMYSEDEGNLYAFPTLSSGARYSLVPIWRDDWLANVGIDKIPETMEEAEEAFYKFVRDDPDQDGAADTYAIHQRGMWGVYGAYGSFPFFFFWKKTEDGSTINPSATDPLMHDAVVKLHQYYEDGLIDPGAFTGLECEGQSYYNTPPFWNGRIGYTVAGTWSNANPPLYEGDMGSNNYQQFKNIQGEDATYAEGPPLTGPGGMGLFKWTLLTGYGVGLGKPVEDQPEKMEKIMEIFEAYGSDEETFLLFRGGIPGETYYLDYGVIMSPKEQQENQQLNWSYAKEANGMALLCNNFDLLDKYTFRPERLEYIQRVANYTSNWENALIGTLPSSAEYKSTIDGLIDAGYAQFITGQRDLAEWDTFVQELYDAGLTVLEGEAKAWYEKYFR